jgi:murein L,D-transpeptidase YafK
VNGDHDLKILVDSLGIRNDQIRISIHKSGYRLSVFADSVLLKEYPVVFGGNPVDDKLRQGDLCTPEGEFRVRAKYPHRHWEKFIWINYPTEASWEKHRNAKREGLINESVGIGGEIGIHGVPEGTDFIIDRKINWTLGCISMKNRDVSEIYPYINVGTPVTIER